MCPGLPWYFWCTRGMLVLFIRLVREGRWWGIEHLLVRIILTLDEVVELLEVEEAMLDTLSILLLDDEVLGVNLVLTKALPLVLTHELGEGAVELLHILWEQLTVAEHLL